MDPNISWHDIFVSLRAFEFFKLDLQFLGFFLRESSWGLSGEGCLTFMSSTVLVRLFIGAGVWNLSLDYREVDF